jgi:hypothetical protein
MKAPIPAAAAAAGLDPSHHFHFLVHRPRGGPVLAGEFLVPFTGLGNHQNAELQDGRTAVDKRAGLLRCALSGVSRACGASVARLKTGKP